MCRDTDVSPLKDALIYHLDAFSKGEKKDKHEVFQLLLPKMIWKKGDSQGERSQLTPHTNLHTYVTSWTSVMNEINIAPIYRKQPINRFGSNHYGKKARCFKVRRQVFFFVCFFFTPTSIITSKKKSFSACNYIHDGPHIQCKISTCLRRRLLANDGQYRDKILRETQGTQTS